MPSKPFYYLSAYLILQNHNKVLLSKRKNTGWFDGYYSLIAGHLHPKESASTAIIREAKEEIGIFLLKENLNLLTVGQRFDGGGRHYIEYFFSSRSWEGVPKNKEGNKCEEILWVEFSQIQHQKLVPHVLQSLQSIQKNEFFHTLGF